MLSKCLAIAALASQAVALSPSEIEARKGFKAAIFSQLAQAEGRAVIAGEIPLQTGFTVTEGSWFHWTIRNRDVAAFSEEIGLPSNMRLAKVAVVEGERPRYYLSGNPYKATIASIPLERMDWLTFVTTDEDPIPRYVVIEGYDRSDQGFNVLEGRKEVSNNYTYTSNPGLAPGPVTVEIDDVKTQFKASFEVPQRSKLNQRKLSREYLWPATSKNYYLNNVVDYTSFNDEFTEATLTRVSPWRVNVEVEHTRFAPFVKNRPRHTLCFTKPVPLVVTQWPNLFNDDPALASTSEEVLDALRKEAKSYGALKLLEASSVSAGTGDTFTAITVDEQPPAIFINFEVPYKKLCEFKEMLNLPEGLQLAKQAATPGEAPKYILVLNVYQTTIGETGFRAEWSTFVTSEIDGHMKPFFLVVDVTSSVSSADVISTTTPPAEKFVYGVDADGQLVTDVVDGDLQFEASFPAPDISACTDGLAYNFIRANDRIYWGDTGVYDRGFYSSEAFDAKIRIIDAADVRVTDNTRWAGIIDEVPYQTFAFCNEVTYTVQPWKNIGTVEPTKPDEEIPCSIGQCCDFAPTQDPTADCGLIASSFGCDGVVPAPDGSTVPVELICAQTCEASVCESEPEPEPGCAFGQCCDFAPTQDPTADCGLIASSFGCDGVAPAPDGSTAPVQLICAKTCGCGQ